jgi:hypothetical protein
VCQEYYQRLHITNLASHVFPMFLICFVFQSVGVCSTYVFLYAFRMIATPADSTCFIYKCNISEWHTKESSKDYVFGLLKVNIKNVCKMYVCNVYIHCMVSVLLKLCYIPYVNYIQDLFHLKLICFWCMFLKHLHLPMSTKFCKKKWHFVYVLLERLQ